MKIEVAGENALLIRFGDTISEELSMEVQHCVACLDRAMGNQAVTDPAVKVVDGDAAAIAYGVIDGVIDIVPSYASVLVLFDALRYSHAQMSRFIRNALQGDSPTQRGGSREVVLPVYYAPESGEDLEALAQRASLSVDALIELHSGTAYRVYAIGFAPGFGYLGEVDKRIAAPRHASPRPQVPAGSVAIADRQTAVYPAPSPGGWHLIGRCPLPMFDPASNPPIPFSVGDTVKFEPIERDKYIELGGLL